MKQPTFNWEEEDKYYELKTFRLEVHNILMMYNTPQTEQLMIGKNWLCRKSLQFLELLTNAEKDTCSALLDLFKILANMFRPQFNQMIKLLQFCKLWIKDGENAEEWMGRLQLSAIECNYKQLDIQLKEQFIHGLNDTDMLGKISRS